MVSLDDLPADLLGAFEYGYSTVHSEKPDLDEAERLEMELDLIRQWCDSFEIAIPANLSEVYQSWRTQYEDTLAAIDEGTTPSDNPGTQSDTVDSVTPPSNNGGSGSQSSGGNTSKPSTGSSNSSSGNSSGSSSSSGSSNSGAPSKEELEAALGKPATMDPNAPEGVLDGSGTYLDPEDLKPDGVQGTISW